MQIAYFDCFSGISGDMTLAALIDAGADLAVIQAAITSLELGDVRLTVSNTSKRGFRGKLLRIDHPEEHSHRFLRDILALLRKAKISTNAKDLAMRLFERIARAEAKVHGTTIDRVQFHEVGAIDSIVDIVGVSVAWDLLQIERAYSSPVPTGTGQVRIAHGTVAIPAPATAELLVGVPIAATQIPIEMTTPTGAAIVSELAAEFGGMPPMQVGRIGYGAGNKEMPDRPNLLRILVGNAIKPTGKNDDSILVMESNLDDISGEQIGFALEMLWKAGALDVFTVPIQMKKNRPGTLLTVIAKPQDRKAIETILFEQTGTLGIRYRKQARTILPRTAVQVQTPWGIVAGKVSELPNGEINFSPESDDCSQIATDYGLRWLDVVRRVEECYQNERNAPVFEDSTTLANVSDDIAQLDHVNAVFRQTAIEEELASLAFQMGADKKESTPEIASTIDPLEQNTHYRWDSSPWPTAEDRPKPPV
ncbi:MAG: nickel pincer cofactor biosynthesis protein LarC [Planctomycetota bacterium]|nr:nickel pincer cofactor biosynthesis protein LarC [Planctomycetota bacterium]